MPLTADRLRELFDYDRETGSFTRRVTAGGQVPGPVMKKPDNLGYICISVDGKSYKAHRLAWLYVHGNWPPSDIDHKDGCRDHNWIANLRPATVSQNKANSRLYSNNTHGFKGIRLHRPNGRWQAKIGVGGKSRSLGYYENKEDAAAAYLSAAREIYGEFARAG